MLSVLIPARNEQYLQNTIDDVLKNAEGDIEVIAVCDGYWPNPGIKDDPRVVLIHHTEARGQRASVNEAARVAKGEYLMKLDAHCAMDKGFDVKLIKDYEEGTVVIPRMYNLDRNTWLPKTHKRTDYMYIGWNEKDQLRSLYYSGNDWKRWHRREQEIDETMGCMGPCRFTSKKTYWDLGGCDERHGSWGSEGIEWACKAWLSGGKMVVNKKTWFAHWFRGSDGGFPYHITQKDVDRARKHAENLWLQNKWEGAKYPFAYIINKFNPPGWDNYGKGVFIHIPKTGGTTIESVLKLESFRNQRAAPKWKGNTHASFGHLPYRRIRHDLSEKFVFTFVRNPYDRAVSNWRHSHSHLTFKQYLKNADQFHWHERAAQAVWLRGVEPGFIGRFENIEDDIRYVAKVLNVPVDTIPNLNSTKHGPYQYYYDSESAQIVHERFKEDFVTYGYNHSLLQ